jgi:mannan endo-1,4-beta-mannosidase
MWLISVGYLLSGSSWIYAASADISWLYRIKKWDFTEYRGVSVTETVDRMELDIVPWNPKTRQFIEIRRDAPNGPVIGKFVVGPLEPRTTPIASLATIKPLSPWKHDIYLISYGSFLLPSSAALRLISTDGDIYSQSGSSIRRSVDTPKSAVPHEENTTGKNRVHALSPSVILAEPGKTLTLPIRFDTIKTSEPHYIFLRFFSREKWVYVFWQDFAPKVPTTTWTGLYEDVRSISLPANTKEGTYEVHVSLYKMRSPWTHLQIAWRAWVIEQTYQWSSRYQIGTIRVGTSSWVQGTPSPSLLATGSSRIPPSRIVVPPARPRTPVPGTCGAMDPALVRAKNYTYLCKTGTLTGTNISISRQGDIQGSWECLGSAGGESISCAGRWHTLVSTPGLIAERSGFSVSGSTILSPEGKIFVPVGANVGKNGGFNWKWSIDGKLREVQAWKWNTIRLNEWCTDSESWKVRSKSGFEALTREVAAIVDEFTKSNIVVILSCHDLTHGLYKPADYAKYDAQVQEFFRDAAKRYKDNPYVWFNPLNEPYWENSTAWLEAQKKYLRLIRDAWAENIFIADALNMGQDAGWDGAPRLYADSLWPALVRSWKNIVFGLHAYGGIGWTPEYRAYFEAIKKAGLALIVSEAGYTIDGSTTAGDYALNVRWYNAVTELWPNAWIGTLWWHATHGDMFSLKKSGGSFYADGGPLESLSPAGKSFADYSTKMSALSR